MIIGLVLLVVVGVSFAQTGSRTIAVIFEKPTQHIPDFSLIKRLNDQLLMQDGLKVIIPGEDSTLPNVPNGRFDLDRIVEWGQEVGCRYIIYLQVDYRKIITRKQRSIPFLLSRYVVEGRIDGMYSLIDLSRNKVVGNWKLETRLTGPRQWQVGEEYPDDPDLTFSVPRKIAFLARLDDQATKEILNTIRRHLRGR